METTAEVDRLLTRLVSGQKLVLGDELIGSYLFGSVVTGNFEPGVSDVDTVAVLRSHPTEDQIAQLGGLHRDIVNEMPRWDDRVEVVYLSARALERFRAETSPAARISPGEPFHAIHVDHRWLIDWYQLRTIGLPLVGPSPTTLVPEISEDEYVEAVRQHAIASSAWAGPLVVAGAQAYAILTLCRALRTVRTRRYVSKREAARWACEELPGHASLIRAALIWREHARGGSVYGEGDGDRAATERFIRDVIRLVDET